MVPFTKAQDIYLFSVASSHNSITEISIFLLKSFNQSQHSSLFSSAELYYDWLKKKLKAKLSQLQTLYSIQPNLTLKSHFKSKIDSFLTFLSINLQEMYGKFYFVFKNKYKMKMKCENNRILSESFIILP